MKKTQPKILIFFFPGCFYFPPCTSQKPNDGYLSIFRENCEYSYSIKDCLDIHEMCGVPIVFDTHHHECYKKIYPEEEFLQTKEYIPLILETWKSIGIKPKFHVSEQGKGRIGKHIYDVDVTRMCSLYMKLNIVFKYSGENYAKRFSD